MNLLIQASAVVGGCGLIYAAIAAPVVWLSSVFSRNNGRKSSLVRDYDNRWPGYPKVPGDQGYSRFYKGPMGNLPEQRLFFQGDEPGEWIDVS